MPQSIVGKWKSIDDDSNKSQIGSEVYEKDGKVFGAHREFVQEQGEDPDPVCDQCEKDDPRYQEDHRNGDHQGYVGRRTSV